MVDVVSGGTQGLALLRRGAHGVVARLAAACAWTARCRGTLVRNMVQPSPHPPSTSF